MQTVTTASGRQPIVWLHIGSGKTGTTALQTYCVARAKGDPNFHYPETGRSPSGAHHLLFPLETQPKAIAQAPALLRDVRAQIDALPADSTVLLSSEHLCYFRDKQVAQLCSIFEGLELRILYYVRRQSDLIESALKWNLESSPGASPDPGAYFNANPRAFNFMQRLVPWRAYFPDTAFHARLYHRETCERDIVGDLRQVVGLSDIPVDMAQARRRVSLGGDMTRVLVAYDRVHEDPAQRARFLEALRQIEGNWTRQLGDRLFSAQERNAIMERYRPSNERFAELFLTDQERKLLLATEV